ncbi:hypothetical protein CALVIDRAFT_404044 [Calocera viscosa TUFC12733]|uniref:FHA domain-containing protein n=1 Tax=Calocera viscosa (strain TUFC12733) TaxID=1330018 RepID=A0A167PVB1_CALVF|nr:hypothetical protein CALVIDRAFT_404044 [Calocera viscosa TUFC12733]
MFASTIITTLSGILLRTPRAPSAADAHAAIYGDPHPVGVSISFGRIGCMFLLGENNKVVSTFPVDKPSISVGGLSTCDIRLYFMNVLRVEATIYFNFDTHSAHFFPMKASYTLNGVKVRGRSVGTSFALEDGDILRIGKRNFMWKYAEGKDDLTQAVFDSKPAVRGFRMSILPVATLLPKDPNKQQTVPLPTLPDMISAHDGSSLPVPWPSLDWHGNIR